MKNQNNDTFSLAQGKYPWGFVKKQINSKFVEIGSFWWSIIYENERISLFVRSVLPFVQLIKNPVRNIRYLYC